MADFHKDDIARVGRMVLGWSKIKPSDKAAVSTFIDALDKSSVPEAAGDIGFAITGESDEDDEFFDDPDGAICGECGERSNDPNHAANCTPVRDYISLQAASKRAGSEHEEVVINDRPFCKVCGYADQGEPNMEFHPEFYFADNDQDEEG